MRFKDVPQEGSYEAALPEEERIALHALLLSGITLAEAREKVAPWPAGPEQGNKPSIASLGRVRLRLRIAETVRGYSANVLLTEFAFFENPEATWRAIVPSVTNPLRGGTKKVRLITTPNGIGNKAHDIWVKSYQSKDGLGLGAGLRLGTEAASHNLNPNPNPNPAAGTPWSCHFVDIYTAVKEGLSLDIEEMRAAVDDPEGWAQEFECQFLDAQAVLLPYELIASCESVEATTAVPPEYWEAKLQFAVDMGIDFGRRQDLTVCWSNAQLGDVAQTIEVLELPKMSTPDQINILRPRLKRARRVCLDCTGPGVGMGDYLVREFGEWNPAKHIYGKIELITFSNTVKVELFSKLRMAFEKRSVRVPISRLVRVLCAPGHARQHLTLPMKTCEIHPCKTLRKNASSTPGKVLPSASNMFMAALPALSSLQYNYWDLLIVAWLLVGILVGRRRGMTQEVLPFMQWACIVVLAGFCYAPLADLIHQVTTGAFNRLWSNITAYVMIAFAIHLFFLWLKQGVGEKLTGSDYFGRNEYYLGMLAGLLRHACMLIALCALMNSHIYTLAELAETEKMQKKNFEDIRFPTYGSVQHALLIESQTGQWIENHLSRVLISSTALSKPAETLGQKREDSLNAILGAPKK